MNDPCCTGELTSPLSEDATAELARRLGALADPARLQIIAILAAARASADDVPNERRAPHDRDDVTGAAASGLAAAGSVCACDFVGPLGKAQPTVSHHLKVLSNAGLVVGERHGRWIWYRLADDGLADVTRHLQSIALPSSGLASSGPGPAARRPLDIAEPAG